MVIVTHESYDCVLVGTGKQKGLESLWSFRKTVTMGTLASQAEIGVWVQALGRLDRLQGFGVSPPEKTTEIAM